MNFQPFAIGKYEFVEILGRGGMAEVYRVCLRGEKGFSKEFAIKRVLRGALREQNLDKMFEEEARLTSILNHANIVQVFEFFESSGNYFLVMELVLGKNLAVMMKELRRKKIALPEGISLYIIYEVCKGLEYAHNKRDPKTGSPLNIIHRDISPQNIMISYEAGVKIVDFGIAKARTSGSSTGSGTITGKIHYMSPEQAWGKTLDARSDIFSTCALLLELLTNKKLFTDKEDLTALRSVQDFTRETMCQRLSNIKPAIADILKRGLEPNTDFRYQLVSQLRLALQQYLMANFPDLDQLEVARWLNDHCMHPQDSVTTKSIAFEPLTVSEKQSMQEGLTRLETTYINQAIPVPPKSPPPLNHKVWQPPEIPTPAIIEEKREKSHEFSFMIALSLILGMVIIFGYFKFHPQTQEHLAANNDANLTGINTAKNPPKITKNESPSENSPAPLALSLQPNSGSPELPKHTPLASLKEERTVVTPPAETTKTTLSPVDKSEGTLIINRAPANAYSQKEEPAEDKLAGKKSKLRIPPPEVDGHGAKPLASNPVIDSHKISNSKIKSKLTPLKSIASPNESKNSQPRNTMQITKVPPVSDANLQAEQAAWEQKLKEAQTASNREFEKVEANLERDTAAEGQGAAEELYLKGNLAFQRRDYNAALEAFHKCRKIKPNHLDSWLSEIKTLETLGRPREAAETAQFLMNLRPELKRSTSLRKYQ